MKSGSTNIGVPNEFVEHVARKAGISTDNARALCKLVLGYIVEKTFREGKLTIQGFGKFKRVTVPARYHYNPATGALIKAPTKKTLKFYLAKNLIKKET